MNLRSDLRPKRKHKRTEGPTYTLGRIFGLTVDSPGAISKVMFYCVTAMFCFVFPDPSWVELTSNLQRSFEGLQAGTTGSTNDRTEEHPDEFVNGRSRIRPHTQTTRTTLSDTHTNCQRISSSRRTNDVASSTVETCRHVQPRGCLGKAF